MKTYKGLITKLEPNQIFVFGSNPQGRHGKGAALWARQNAGAIYGQGEGLQGQSYAIITKDLTKSVHPSISSYSIIGAIKELYAYCLSLSLDGEPKEFLIAYSATGTNLNGYTNKEMAKMFAVAAKGFGIPRGIVFEEGFAELVLKQLI